MALFDFFTRKTAEPATVLPVLPEEIYRTGVLGLQDVIAPHALKISPRELDLGEKIARTFFVISYPRFLTTGWFAPIINMDKVLDVSIYIHPMDTNEMLRKFQKKVAEVQSQIATREEKGMVRDPILDTAYADLEKLRDSLQQAQERIFEVGLYLTIYGSTREDIDKVESEIRSILESRLVYIRPALFQQEQGFRSVLPLATDELNVHTKLNSAPLSSIFPFISFDLTSDRGILYGINRHNSSLILFDRFSLENYNSVTFAKSGAGKSIFVKERVLMRDRGVVRNVEIGLYIDALIRKHGATQIDEELEGVIDPDVEVFSFDKHMKGRWSKVSVAARKDATDTYYTFTTKSGREITTTADHNMLVLRDGRVVAAKSEDVKEGEYIPLPRSITVAATQTLTPMSPDLGALLGWIAAEGSTTDRSIIISNEDPEGLADIKRCCAALSLRHGSHPRWIAIYSSAFRDYVHGIRGAGLSHKKHVAGPIFDAPREAVAAYLRAYFEGDGGVDGAAVTALSKSRALISDLSYLCYYFGIIVRIHRRQKTYAKTGRKRTFWQMSISGQDNLRKFQEHIGFISTRKKEALARLTTKVENTNCDIVPGLQPLAQELAGLFDTQLSDISDFSALKQGHDLSPKRLGKLVEMMEARVQRFKDLYPFMQKLQDLPTVEAIVKKADEDRELNRTLIEKLSSSWFTVKQGMPPRTKNALKIFETAGVDAPKTVDDLKGMISEGVERVNVHANGFDEYLARTLNGTRDNSSYELLRTAAQFIVHEYHRTLQNLNRVEEIVATFKTLANADLFWDPIVSIVKKPNKKDKYVYDLTVDDEVFLAGHGGMFVHNSYTTKLEILRSLMFDTEVIVIDPEREYEYLAETVGGRYFNISLSSEHHINPFDLPIPREDESPGDILRNNIITLVGLFRIMLGGLTPEEDAVIDRAITETYALKDITAEANFASVEPPLLSDFELVLSGMEGSDSLVARLSKYTKGTWSGFMNRPTNVDMNKKLVVFSVRDMEDDLKPVAMYIITHHIWNTVRKELRKRLLVIDEAWWMMKSQDTASFLFGIAKRGRKYYLGLSTITQDVNDFLTSPYGTAMITNSSIQILLRQSPTSVDLVQQTFKLSDEEKYLLLESDVGEGIFFAGLKHVAIKVIASYTEDQIITSDPSQILAIKKAKQELARSSELDAEQAFAAPERTQVSSAAATLQAAALKEMSGVPQQAASESLPEIAPGPSPLPPQSIPTPAPTPIQSFSPPTTPPSSSALSASTPLEPPPSAPIIPPQTPLPPGPQPL
ncbi:MAG: LAGLIDADG family homing endonuclease [Patescibacteria group bacterium]